MAGPSADYILELCRQAADLDYGLLIQTSSTDSLRSDIYYKLKCAGITTEDLDIQIAVPSTPNTIYILRRSVELPE
jgi:hypothetical protein